MSDDPIYVTKPYLPPLADYVAMLEQIWDRRILTNGGPFHREFEDRLAVYLDVAAVSLTTNGALALEIAIEAANLEGEVITTPYSFVATTHSVLRERLQPIFVDIDPCDFNIDPIRIEAAITPRTSAIMGVHCYGNPCDVVAIEAIARRHGLMVIYDAAHAFGVRLNGRSVFNWGDYSTLSFHATKSFQTFEGGAICMIRPESKEVVDRLKNFGISSEVSIPAIGTNAKMSELNAAMGLLQLDHYGRIRAARATIAAAYRRDLAGIRGIEVPQTPAGVEPNNSYFPILIGDEYPLSRDELYEKLLEQAIYSRRYFYPLLSSLSMYADAPSAAPENLPIANRVAQQVLCLPIYPDLSPSDTARIATVIREAGNRSSG